MDDDGGNGDDSDSGEEMDEEERADRHRTMLGKFKEEMERDDKRQKQ